MPVQEHTEHGEHDDPDVVDDNVLADPDPRTMTRAALVAALQPIVDAAPKPWENWGRTFLCQPQARFRPSTVHHCRLALELARRDNRTLRPAGIGHSPSDVACTNDYLLLTPALNRVLSIDTIRKCVTAQAGITLSELHAALASHGLAMRNLGSISDQTLAGIVATATHGAGSAFGVMSTHVLGLTLLLPDNGPPVACSPTQNAGLFTATICGLGATGLILTITLEVEDAFRLRDVHRVVPFPRFVEGLDEMKHEGEHVRFWWFPAVGKVRVMAASRTREPLRPAGSWFWDSLVGFHAVQFLLLLARYARWEPLAWLAPLCGFLARLGAFLARLFSWSLSLASPPAASQDNCTPLTRLAHARPLNRANAWAAALACWLAGPGGVVVDESVRVFNIECRYLQHTTEWALPAARARNCLRALGDWLEREQRDRGGERPHFPIEVRFSAGDDIWLSPSSGGETCWIGIVQFKPYNLPTRYRALFAAFERILAAHGGRPHWAKAHHLDARTTRALYPEFPRFLKVVEEVDPTGIFRNEYIERHLMGGTGDGREYKRFNPSQSVTSSSETTTRWWPWARWSRSTKAPIRDWRIPPEGVREDPPPIREEHGARGEEEQKQELEDDASTDSDWDADSEATLHSRTSTEGETGKLGGVEAEWSPSLPHPAPVPEQKPKPPPRRRPDAQPSDPHPRTKPKMF